jgi:hypothetical protein
MLSDIGVFQTDSMGLVDRLERDANLYQQRYIQGETWRALSRQTNSGSSSIAHVAMHEAMHSVSPQAHQAQPTQPTLTATVSETPEVTFYFNAYLYTDPNGKPVYFTGYGAVQKITLLQDGKPVVGVTGTESVVGLKGEDLIQNPKSVNSQENGEILDLISRGAFTNEKVDEEFGEKVFKVNGNNPVDITTRQTLTVTLPDGSRAQIIFDRRFRNVDDNGDLRPPGPMRSDVPTNYSLNVVSAVTVKRLP